MAISHEPSIFPGLVRALSMDSAAPQDRHGGRAETMHVSGAALYILGVLLVVPVCTAKYVSEERFACCNPSCGWLLSHSHALGTNTHIRGSEVQRLHFPVVIYAPLLPSNNHHHRRSKWQALLSL